MTSPPDTRPPGVCTAPPPGNQVRAATVSAFSQLAGRVIHLVLNLVSTLAILRYLAPEAYGSYALVVLVSAIAGVIADFGLPKLALRELARAGVGDSDEADGTREQNELTGTIVILRLGLTLVAAAAAQGVLVMLNQPTAVHQAAAVVSLALVAEAVLGIVVVSFQVRLVQQYESVIRVVAEAAETALVLVLISLGARLTTLFWAPVAGLALGAALAVLLARRRFRLRLRFAPVRVRALVREALPMGPGLLIGVLYLKLDSLIVAKLRPPAELGIYASAYQPVEYLFLATAVIINVLFPIIAREWAHGDQVGFAQRYRRGTELLVTVTAFVPLTLAFVAPGVVALAFGPAYADAATPLRILSVALVILTISGWQALVLITAGLQRVILLYNIGALLLALGLCTLGVRWAGLAGAAGSVVITASALVAVSMAVLRRRLGVRLHLAPLLRIALALGGTALVLAGLHAAGLPWPVLAGAAAVVYAALLLRLGIRHSVREAFA